MTAPSWWGATNPQTPDDFIDDLLAALEGCDEDKVMSALMYLSSNTDIVPPARWCEVWDSLPHLAKLNGFMRERVEIIHKHIPH